MSTITEAPDSAKAKRDLKKTLKNLGFDQVKISLTGLRQGNPCWYVTLPMSADVHREALESAGYFVQVNRIVSISTANIA